MKVLIISHNPVSSRSNMGKTFLTLFSGFAREELCQLYIYPAFPDRDICASYYRMTDKEALASVLSRKQPGGEVDHRVISAQQGLYEHPEDQTIYKSRKNKSALRRLLRDAMWQLSPWNSKALKQWLDKEKPDCIFVAPGVAKFLYNFALTISRQRKIPIVCYFCDEYYFSKQPEGQLDKLRLKLLQNKVRQLLEHSCHLITISEEMRSAYADAFAIPTTALMNGASDMLSVRNTEPREPRVICYFGNVRCNRYVSLAEVGQELDRINREQGTDYQLKIYSAEQDPEILGEFADIRSVELCAFVSGEEYTAAVENADLLLHVEAFDTDSIDFTKHSISTKIADSLASGIPVVAYGPESVASMRHLARHNCAIQAASREELGAALRKAFEEETVRRLAAENGLLAAAAFHNKENNSAVLRRILEEASGNG